MALQCEANKHKLASLHHFIICIPMDTKSRRQAIGRLGAAQRKVNFDIKTAKLKENSMILHYKKKRKKDDDDDDDGSSGVCSGEPFPMSAHDNIPGLMDDDNDDHNNDVGGDLGSDEIWPDSEYAAAVDGTYTVYV